jgi:signal transduction histidine kinase
VRLGICLSRGAPLLLGLLAAAGTLALWRELVEHEREQVARLVAAVSYKTRSELARRMDVRQQALRELAEFWGHFEDTPAGEWESQVQLQRGLLGGMEFLAWGDAENGVRRYATPEDLDLGRPATESERRSIRDVFAKARTSSEPSMAGPTFDEEGRASWCTSVPARGPGGERGILVARFTAQEVLHEILQDESPGYAISVSWRDREIYRTADAVPAADLPPSWRSEGAIRLPFGALWKVRHEPTAELMASLGSHDSRFALLGGLLISTLVAALAFESQRARREAQAARAAEAQLRSLNLDLEARVARRTLELDEALAELHAFNSFVSHDLKSPLGAVLNFSAILREDYEQALGARGLEQLAHISQAAASGLARIEGLLALSQVGRDGLQRERVEVAGLVRETFEEVRLQAGSPPIELELGRVESVWADPGLLRTALANLLGNALKFTRGEASPRIEVETESRAREVVLHVRDNGYGFDMRLCHKLFQPFGRLHPEQSEGHGLGLAIVERVARRHGGRVWAQGRPGEGATFFLSLPRGPDRATAESSLADDPGRRAPAGGPMRRCVSASRWPDRR